MQPVLKPNEAFSVDFGKPDQRRAWCARAVNTEAFFSFLSGLVVKRATWDAGRLPPEFERSCWGHVARYFELSEKALRVSYVAEIWLDRRSGNDSFADRGVVHRCRIAIEGYTKLADRYFGSDSVEAGHIRRVLRREFGVIPFMHARRACARRPEVEDAAMLRKIHQMIYDDRGATFERAHWLLIRLAAVPSGPLARAAFETVQKVGKLVAR